MQKPNFLTLNPLPIYGLSFFETGHLAQMLHSVGLYHHAKNQKIYNSISEKMSKNTIFCHLITLNTRIKIFFQNSGSCHFFCFIDPQLHAKFYKDLIMASYRTLMDRQTDGRTDGRTDGQTRPIT